jgi:hypothetical protein|tara:strand:+ start:151 stop:345 length:195 start_codon:yes stop_codon:yes gene_type:complete
LLPVTHRDAGVLYEGQGILLGLPNDTIISFACLMFIYALQKINKVKKLLPLFQWLLGGENLINL